MTRRDAVEPRSGDSQNRNLGFAVFSRFMLKKQHLIYRINELKHVYIRRKTPMLLGVFLLLIRCSIERLDDDILYRIIVGIELHEFFPDLAFALKLKSFGKFIRRELI